MDQKMAKLFGKLFTALNTAVDLLSEIEERINEADEVELFGKWKEQTGRKADDIVGNSIFKKEIEEIRIAKANLRATSDIKGERGESGVRNTPDYWIAKATKGADGKLMFHDETPKELYSKILDKLQESEPSSSQELKFYNQK